MAVGRSDACMAALRHAAAQACFGATFVQLLDSQRLVSVRTTSCVSSTGGLNALGDRAKSTLE